MSFTHKSAVITGGANGIGRCIAAEFSKVGSRVAVMDKDGNAPACDLFYHGDIADENALTEFVLQVAKKFGKVDYLINNAMLSRKGIISGCSWEDFLYVQKIGVAAPYLLSSLLLPHFAENAAIVNICSTRAFMVRVNAISPGWIDTTGSEWSREDNAQHPVGRVGKPLDIAKMVLYLCGEDSGFITGENITVDGGMSKLMVYHNDAGWKYGIE